MTYKPFKRLVVATLAIAAMSVTATAKPVLLSNVVVHSAIVTVGDMFGDAGPLAEKALFRAPAPGTAGTVSVEAVRAAATRAGITDFENPGVLGVKVSRQGTLIDENLLTGLIEDELTRRGTLTQNMSTQVWLDSMLPTVHAASGNQPARLKDFRYMDNSGQFAARFEIAGRTTPIDISGRIDLMIEVPHLASAKSAGSLLSPDDIEMRPVSLRFAESNGIAGLQDLVGHELKRPARAGKMLAVSDVMEPLLITRNQEVTLYYRSGPMTLTVKGRALGDAARNDSLTVMNLMSNKVVSGVATDHGAVEISGTILTAANQ